jgi:CRP/FNR family nitrogen fixation transcriptional regulator
MRAKAVSTVTNIHHRALPVRSNQLGALDSLAVTMSCHRGEEICCQSCAALFLYCVKSGAAIRYVARTDGHRQIVDLLFPGDFFGFAAGGEYDYTVDVVVEGTVVACYPRQRMELLADADPRLARELREATLKAISRLQAQLVIMGRITALEKVGSFLLEMAERMSDGSPELVVLPISRYDVADYLALSVETVSRALTDLKHRGVIKLCGTRCVKIVDQDALRGDRDSSPAYVYCRSPH